MSESTKGDRVSRSSQGTAGLAVRASENRADAVAGCSYTEASLFSPAGEIVVLRIAGEVDLSTIAALQATLAGNLARGPCHLVVDLAGLTFCSARGAALLVEAGHIAAAQGTGYTVTSASGSIVRIWMLLWTASDLPVQCPSEAAGVIAAVAGQTDNAAPSSASRGRPIATAQDAS